MKTNRQVLSKHLFNYVPKGQLDDDIKKNRPTIWFWLKFGAAIFVYLIYYFISTFIMRIDFEFPGQKAIVAVLLMGRGFVFNDDENFTKGFRILCNFAFELLQSGGGYEKELEKCYHSEFSVPTSHLGEHSVPVLVHTPYKLIDQSRRPVIIYAHGGGVIGCTALCHKRYLAKLASTCNVVIFNVEYRRAPETKCPNNILDFYEVLKYTVQNSKSLGIDTSRISIAGESGGGYICFGTMVLLAQKNESNIVKLAMPIVPMIDDDSFHLTNMLSITNVGLRKIWKLIAQDIKKQKDDPLLFPGKASNEILQNMPPTIIWEAEFDMFIKENTRIAKRLQTTGRLLEFVVFPGLTHGSWINPRSKCHELVFDAYALATQKYLIE